MAIVTISRQLGSGGDWIARRLAEETGYLLLDQPTLLFLLGEKLRQPGRVRVLEDRPIAFLEHLDHNRRDFESNLEALILELASRHHTVIVGRGSQCLLAHHPDALHIRIVAPREQRIARLAESRQIPLEQAARQIDQTDVARENLLRYRYRVDPDDPSLYHLILNTGRLSLNEALLTVLELVRAVQPSAATRSAADVGKLAAQLRQEHTLVVPGTAVTAAAPGPTAVAGSDHTPAPEIGGSETPPSVRNPAERNQISQIQQRLAALVTSAARQARRAGSPVLPWRHQVHRDEQGRPQFAHPSESEFARLLDFYGVPWEYEPLTFPLEWDDKGQVTEAFTPDFYLPALDLFLELTTMKQGLVTKKNKKVRRLRELYPDIHIKVFYSRDYRMLLKKLGKEPGQPIPVQPSLVSLSSPAPTPALASNRSPAAPSHPTNGLADSGPGQAACAAS
ncbi:MAG: cytidylate kinase family protein [Limnochordaceae bacterium]|nr:cytidylate kinase family protein [Limnochordaceae bacterium]